MKIKYPSEESESTFKKTSYCKLSRLFNMMVTNKLIVLLLVLTSYQTYSQELIKAKKPFHVGFNYGQSSQSRFPFGNKNYTYNNQYLKVQLTTTLKEKRKFKINFLVEPSIYFSEHQLLNPTFVEEQRGEDFLEQRERFIQKKSFHEYVLNAGFQVRYSVFRNFSMYIIGSIGPMISTGDTERLKKGFAFSDIAGFGVSQELKRLLIDFRLSVRHNSNANLQMPNNGHNAVCIESGVSYRLRSK